MVVSVAAPPTGTATSSAVGTMCRTGILLSSLLIAAPSAAQQLTIQGAQFAIDGNPRFLTFITYFGALGAADVATDLQFLHDVGFDGVRVMTNWRDSPKLMREDGSLNPDLVDRLLFILDRARALRLVVDITFNAEQVEGLDAARFRHAIIATTVAVMAYDNVLFDIQNERDVYGPFFRSLSPANVAAIATAIKAVDPSRIVTASNSPNTSPSDAARFTADSGLDVTAYHDDRVRNWFDRGRLASIVDVLRTSGRPAYLQEPARFPFPSTDRADYFRLARENAKRVGAAAWCFHTDLGFNLRDARFSELLQFRQEPEWAFVTSLIVRVQLRTADGYFVTAEGGGGLAVHADRRQPGEWQTFVMTARDGGPVLDGDRITLRTSDGRHYLQASFGGSDLLTAAGTIEGSWETFVIETGRDAPVRDGDACRLRTTSDPAWYASADAGGGGDVHVNQRSAGRWETFSVVGAW